MKVGDLFHFDDNLFWDKGIKILFETSAQGNLLKFWDLKRNLSIWYSEKTITMLIKHGIIKKIG